MGQFSFGVWGNTGHDWAVWLLKDADLAPLRFRTTRSKLLIIIWTALKMVENTNAKSKQLSKSISTRIWIAQSLQRPIFQLAVASDRSCPPMIGNHWTTGEEIDPHPNGQKCEKHPPAVGPGVFWFSLAHCRSASWETILFPLSVATRLSRCSNS